MTANSEKIKFDIEFLRKVSQPCAAGTTRLSYTDEYKQAAAYIKDKMSETGLEVLEDGIGNIYGRLCGTDAKLPAILCGSHLDSVKCAGAFDGIAGVACALEVARILRRNKRALRHPFVVAALVEEEGTRFGQACMGSKFATGIYSEKELDTFADDSGLSLRTALKQYHPQGFCAPFEMEKVIGKTAAFLELHSEQGPVLERENIDIGIVDKIVSVCWLSVTVTGFAGHSGTVPMTSRRDAGIGSFRMIDAINRFVTEKFPSAATATVGKLELLPGSSNCIPDKCTFSIDLRSPDRNIISEIMEYINKQAAQVKKECAVNVDISIKTDLTPAPLDLDVQKMIKKACNKLEYTSRPINSGAGHDAMVFAEKISSAMVFIPCKDGITHNPLEKMSYASLAKGADVLYETLLQIDEA